jgi:hypothetical protein
MARLVRAISFQGGRIGRSPDEHQWSIANGVHHRSGRTSGSIAIIPKNRARKIFEKNWVERLLFIDMNPSDAE